MPRPKELPAGFELLPSQSLRARVRIKGHEKVDRTFPLRGSPTREALDEQFEAAEAWYNETVRRIQRGTYVSSREAETTTLAWPAS